MEVKILKPTLRFKGFTDTWEQYKFDVVVNRIATGLNPRDNFQLNTGGKNYYVTIKNFHHGELRLDDDCDKVDDSALELIQNRSDLQKDDILFSSIGRVGDCYLVDKKPNNWNINESVFTLRPNQKLVAPLYLFHTIHSDVVLSGILNSVTGSTFKSIKVNDLKKAQVPVPSIDEQLKIGEFISSIDNLITLLQRKYEKLVNTKKALLDQMFPKNGDVIPKLRFKGFAGTWEQCVLSDISDVTKLAGFEFTEYVQYSDNGQMIALRGLNVKNNSLVLDDIKYIDGSDFSKLNRSKLYKNDILLTYVGTVGDLAVVPENDKYYLAPNVARIRFGELIYPKYASQLMGSKRFYIRIITPLIATSSQPALSMENVRKFKLDIPKFDEQIKIGDFFEKIDNLITLHQRKYEKLVNIKKALLQKMFV